MHGMHGTPANRYQVACYFRTLGEGMGSYLQLTVAYWPPPLRGMESMRN